MGDLNRQASLVSWYGGDSVHEQGRIWYPKDQSQATKIGVKGMLLSALACTLLNGCGALMPVGVEQRPLAPERLVYQIDEHRFITISGNDSCEGDVFYYNTEYGIRTHVAHTGFRLGHGVAKSRYAIDSTGSIAIPVLTWSDALKGGGVVIYYSYDAGSTFDKLDYGGGEPDEKAKISVQDKYLYIYGNKFGAARFDISHKVQTDDFGRFVSSASASVDPASVPQDIQSPFGVERMSCGAPIPPEQLNQDIPLRKAPHS